jgi:hypothetical protein
MPETRGRPTGSRRRTTTGSSPLITDLTASVNQLIRENKALKQQLARAQPTDGAFASPRQLASLQRRLQTAMTGTGTRTRAVSGTRRRRVQDPAVLESRRASLAKAREALAQKRGKSR